MKMDPKIIFIVIVVLVWGFIYAEIQEGKKNIENYVNDINPDVVICGPSYNYADFSKMSAHIAAYLKENTNIKNINHILVPKIPNLQKLYLYLWC